MSSASPVLRAEAAAAALHSLIVGGDLTPGHRLPEAELAARFGVSRNTLREAFRLLSQEGLVEQRPHRGAVVATPTLTSIIDIYRVRRIIECQAISQAAPRHPAVVDIREAIEHAKSARAAGDWVGVGTANIAYHAAIVALTDSPRLVRVFHQIAAELRLTFGLVGDPEYLHAPFLERNQEILDLFVAGDPQAAAAALDRYLVYAERILVASHERLAAASAAQAADRRARPPPTSVGPWDPSMICWPPTASSPRPSRAATSTVSRTPGLRS